MRPIHVAQLDKPRPVLVLTRELVRPHLNTVTVAPITSRIRGLSTEVPLGVANGLDHACVVSLENVMTVPASALGRQVGHLLPAEERALADALAIAFDLALPD
ncbi:type II toxin-antitoxin system PemK/MazF family toxin [Cellulomonas sp. HZM]|uniref:type II toxin-antitoxin system PemK/MazF family toxin n=1 Tax=Cellulomonas sp. HZM TaxID=1454010 RepID=UPI000492FAEA|nr:type II toxin-antitoxin system PemK/MazF family toxin [Cellulomonas sp. HZM]